MPHSLGPFAAIVFDMDGVLLDTEPLYREAMFRACAELGYEMPEELHNATIGIPGDISDLMMVDHFGPDFPIRDYNRAARKIMLALTEHEVPVKPGVHELLAELNARDIPAAVATSTARPTAPDRLKHAGIHDKFTAIVTRNEVENGKPHPEPFLTAAERIKVAPEDCIALEDSFNGIRSAHAAGMRAVMVPDLLQPSEEITKLCVAVMASLHEVREALFAEEGRGRPPKPLAKAGR